MNPGPDRRIAAGLGLAALLLRLPALRSMPVFGDEAMNLHWAELVRQDFGRFAFVSLQDPKPPLHFWLLALSLPVSRDPVFAGRLFSVLCGAASTALFYVLARDLAREFGSETSRARLEAICGAVLFVLCPFAAFHQRMALTESLFLLEALTAAWLSLRAAAAAVDRRPIVAPALALGVALGAAMLTRQDFSYALWALPLLAWAAKGAPARAAGRALAIAAPAAALLWSPVFLSATGPDWKTRLLQHAVFRQPVPLAQRAANAVEILGWLGMYLTPSIAALAVVGVIVLVRARLRAALFLVGWLLTAIGPLPILASYLFPRYVLVGALPLLLAAAAAASAALAAPGRTRRALAATLLVLVLAWPVADLARAWRRPNDPPLVPVDRWQYVSGWPAGGATERAISRLRAEASRGPLIVLTGAISGNPGDSLWVLLRGRPGVALYTTARYLDGPLLQPDAAGGVSLLGDFRAGDPERSVVLPKDLPVYFVATDPLATRSGWMPAGEFLKTRDPSIVEVWRSFNPADASHPPAGIAIFRIR